MDFLTGEINKLKRKAPEEASTRYFKRGEIEAKRQEEYAQAQQKLQVEKEAREAEKLAQIEEFEAKKLAKKDARLVKSNTNRAKMTEQDLLVIQAELKTLNEPIRLFGEEDQEVRSRLQHVKAKLERLNTSSSALLREVYSTPPDDDLPGPESIEILTEWAKSSKDEEKQKLQSNLFLLLRCYIRDWHVQQSAEIEDPIYKQAREHLARLLLRLKAANLPSDILRNLSNVALGLKKKDYTAANHAYLQMSIGKAAWPVGVTMVGIHERAQRERVKQVEDGAHILSDEITRQWLQSLKRLITHREKHFPAD